jgi:hypothetical protein
MRGSLSCRLSAVEAVHSQKVILNRSKLERRLRQAIGHAHDAEEPNAWPVLAIYLVGLRRQKRCRLEEETALLAFRVWHSDVP